MFRDILIWVSLYIMEHIKKMANAMLLHKSHNIVYIRHSLHKQFYQSP